MSISGKGDVKAFLCGGHTDAANVANFETCTHSHPPADRRRTTIGSEKGASINYSDIIAWLFRGSGTQRTWEKTCREKGSLLERLWENVPVNLLSVALLHFSFYSRSSFRSIVSLFFAFSLYKFTFGR